MRDLLVRYLLGELDADQRQRLESELAKSPDLRRELEYLRECMPASEESLEERPDSGAPPSGLAERTVDWISDCEESGEHRLPPTPSTCAAGESGTSTPYWSFVDLTVAGGVLLAVSMLFLPALRQSRDASRRTVCADNMGQIGRYLIQYAETHEGRFPAGKQDENAGMFAVILVRDQIVSADDLRQQLLCPSSQLAEEVEAGCVVMRIPTPEELANAKGAELYRLRRVMGGSLAYRIGFVDEQNRYKLVGNRHCPRTALMADEPRIQAGDMRTANHGCGTNMLYQDGHVGFVRNCELKRIEDHPYLNDNGVPAAGCHPLDTVLVRSEAVPAATLDAAELGVMRIKPTE